ncbi:putative FAD-linked oxidoreductase YvdP [Streptomyces hundungensis]|uniref:Putative FAD-linked oxidoreductase YvdP n=1 Tax=Streptomyces hundungensis TaxID=1077946 RepID=A0A387HGZ6_9ACTN|nr:FAD-binding oxidoreductase [Streptomyces hundungensis]AYG81533.1 putative FAD-linked oxidoreductase YvdP [Streptomyces hundungensis]
MRRRTLLTAATGAAAALTATACGASGHPEPAPTRTATRSPSPSSPAPADYNALARSLDGRLVRPGDADYATARQLYNTRFDGLRPDAVAYVAHAADVQECLAYARAHHTPVAVRSGGHDYAGWSSGTGRLVIDVSRLNSVAADGTIGAGARLLDVYTGLARSGRTIPGGSCPTVAVSGLALGGGHGVTARAYGLTCDSVTSIDLVTADGRTLTASQKQNPDLFWALRGAGNGNFGVVTGFTFRTHPAPRGVTAFLTWPWRQARGVIEAWQEWGPDQADEIWSAAHLAGAVGGADPTVTIAAFSLGSYGDLQNALDRLADRAGAPAATVALHRTGFQEAMLLYAGCSTFSQAQCHLPGTTPGRTPQGVLQRETYAAKSDFYTKPLPEPGVRQLLARAEEFTRIPPGDNGGGGTLVLTALGGAINRVAPDATAFAHRTSRVLAQYIASWVPGTAGATQQSWLARTHDAMRPYASGAAYQNYPDPALTDWRTAYYGAGAGRLARLKRQYDPGRLFDFPQAL